MFFKEVVNEWEEVTYVPTPLGYAAGVVVLLLLVAAAVFLAKKGSQTPDADENGRKQLGKMNAKRLVFCAMSLALGVALSVVSGILPSMPMGGSVTLFSMLVVCLPGYFYGLGTGLLTGVAYGVLQLLIKPYVLYPAQLVMDYILAFGALGLSGLFSNAKKNGLLLGYVAAILGRYVFAVLSGVLFFAAYAWEGWNPMLYSLAYNGIYIFAEAAVTVLILQIPSVKKAIAVVKKLAAEA